MNGEDQRKAKVTSPCHICSKEILKTRMKQHIRMVHETTVISAGDSLDRGSYAATFSCMAPVNKM